MKLLRWIAGTIVALGAVAFAVFNLSPVTVTWSPFHAPITLPASVFGFMAAGIGFLCGGVAAWMGGRAGRAERRRLKKEIRDLQSRLAAEQAAHAPSYPPEHAVPLILPKP